MITEMFFTLLAEGILFGGAIFLIIAVTYIIVHVIVSLWFFIEKVWRDRHE